MVTQSRLHELFDYKDGNLIWKNVTDKKRIKTGYIAGQLFTSQVGRKYWSIRVDKKNYYAHRLIWIFHFGKITKDHIDHIDGNGLNNKVENLREATHKENCRNIKVSSANTSGYTGVYLDKKRNKFVSQIKVDGKHKYLGSFLNIDDALNARIKAEKQYFCEFARKVF